MEQIRACRICLITGVRMNDLRCYPLLNYFESMDGMSPLVNMDLPPYACYECAAYIRKTFWFRERCLRGQETLYNMLSDNGEITEQGINNIDRLHLDLSSNLKTILLEHSINLIHEEEEVYEIKYEQDQDEKEDIQDEKEEIILDFFKDELDMTDLGSPAQIFSDEDNEPLSFHKSNKEKDVKKVPDKKKGRNKKEIVIEKIEYADVAFESASFEAESKKMQSTELAVQRRKRGRPRKNEVVMSVKKERAERRTKNTGGVDDNDIDLEEYVTIIKLTKKEQMDEIEKRKESSNYLNAPYKCSLCFKGFIDTAAWQHHVSKHQPTPGDLECPICKFRFKTKRNLQKHSSNHEKKYACKSCSYVSKTTTQAKQHQRWHKGVTYKCQYCDEVSTKWTSYLSHVRIKHPSEFICGVCGYSFVSQLGLNMHKTMMHKQLQENEEGEKSESGPYCAVCDVKFLGIEAYRRHMVTSVKHTQNNDFKNGCRVCGETFPNGEDLRLHHRRMHARTRPKNYGKKPANTTWPADCEHCGETIPNARDFWTHFRRAHPDKPYPIQKNYVCDICGKSFRGNAFLVYHKRTHTEERAYKCAQCPKAFFNRTNLQMHEKTHSDHRPYPCSVCFKAFKCKGALDRHFRSHTGVKPYECEVCGKAFGQSNSRKLHVRTVHLKQPAPYISRARLERTRKLPAKELTQHPLY